MTWNSSRALILTAAVAALHLAAHPGAHAQEDSNQAEATAPTYADSLRRARDALISAGDFEGALEPAELVIAELERTSDTSIAGDRVMRAVILAGLGRFDEAEAGLLEAIDSFQDVDARDGASVVTPLHLLGRLYLRERRFPQAIAALEEARTMSRRTFGLYNVDQSSVLDDLTTAHLGLGDTETARDLQMDRLETAQRQYGIDDPRVIPYHHHLGDYYAQSRLLASAREQYDTALEIALAHGDETQALVALRMAAATELQMMQPGPTIERLREMLASLEATGSDAAGASHERGLAHAVLGDAALIDADTSLAERHYARSWQLLEAAGQVDPAEFFADPAIVRFTAPASDVDVAVRSLPYAWGTIALEFVVDEDGRVEEITGVGAQPADLMEEAYVERLRQAVFRPTLVDGVPETAEGVVFTHYFRFYVDPDEADD